MRTILLGLLIAGIIPATIADATMLNSRNKVITTPPSKPTNVALAKSCIPSDLVTQCPNSTISRQPKTYSDLLQEISDVLLSSSMFSSCSERSPNTRWQNEQTLLPKNNSSPQSPTPNQSLSLGNSTSKQGKSRAKGCIFSWQKWFKQKTHHKSPQDSNKLASGVVNTQKPIESINSAPIPNFPKLSRASLIISFPKQDSSFVPTNTQLVNPAPETERISSPFGWRRRPYSNQLQFHQGIDYSAPLGSPVVAVGDGIVTKVVSGCFDFGNLFCGGQLGNWIEIDHGNGAIGTYGHLKNSSITIKEGMKVRKNQEIAQVGSSGWSTGAHLDFRLKVNGKQEDPAKHVMDIRPVKK